MNYSNRHLLNRLDALLGLEMNRQRRRAVAKLFRLAKNQGLLRADLVQDWRNVKRLCAEMAEFEAGEKAKRDALAVAEAARVRADDMNRVSVIPADGPGA